MLREKNSFIRKCQYLLDIGTTAGSFFLAIILRDSMGLALPRLFPISHYLFLLYLILPIWSILLYYNNAYQSVRTKTLSQTLMPYLVTPCIGGIFIMAMLFIFKLTKISRTLILLFLFLNTCFFILERTILFISLRHIRKRGYNFRNILIIGTGSRAVNFTKTVISNSDWGLKIIGYIDLDPSMLGHDIEGKKVIGMLKDIPDILTEQQVDEVIFVGPRKWLDHIEDVIFSCEEIGIQVRIICDFYPIKLSRLRMDSLAEWPFLCFAPPPHYGNLLPVKRGIDIFFSSTILLLTAPLLLLIWACIKLTSPGPVFFRQERCGMNGRRFILLKFRTMVNNAEEKRDSIEHLNRMSGPVFKVHGDPRITSIGKLLRKYSLDEIPQFINVLMGDMSIVGPRPPIPEEVVKYDYSQRRRLSVRPGITCLWQVHERNNVDFSSWVKLDLKYIDRWSLALDMKIILKTIPAVLKGTGA